VLEWLEKGARVAKNGLWADPSRCPRGSGGRETVEAATVSAKCAQSTRLTHDLYERSLCFDFLAGF
jgi:hypothetical protein